MKELAALKSITQTELAGKLHVGQDDTPALSTLGMQQLMDAHPNANTTAINQHSTAQNANNAIVRAAIESLESHAASIINPHQVTKEQLGLGNCDNTADADKPVSEAQKAAMAAAIESQEATIAAMRDYIDGVVFEAGAVSSVFGRSGAVVARAGDYTADMVGARPATWTPTAAQVGAVAASEKGAARGIATLNASSRLVQMPTLSEVGGSNRNLMDNWYFLNPVNQKQVSAWTLYTYGIDRWKAYGDTGSSAAVTAQGLVLTRVGTHASLCYHFEKSRVEAGETYTVSIKTDAALQGIHLYKNTEPATVIATKVSPTRGSDGITAWTFTMPENPTDRYIFNFNIKSGATVTFIAVKLEKGNVSTLANDPPPDYGQELAKCQRYYQLYTSAAARPASGVGCRPAMRLAKPTQGTIAINGVTYYYNDANF